MTSARAQYFNVETLAQEVIGLRHVYSEEKKGYVFAINSCLALTGWLLLSKTCRAFFSVSL